MQCEFCDTAIQPGADRCPSCGAAPSGATATPQYQGHQSPRQGHQSPGQQVVQEIHHHHHGSVNTNGGVSPKSRLVAGLLGLFLGCFGVHNFYLGYIGRGIVQVVLTLTILGIYITAVWALIESIIILASKNPKDAAGLSLEY